MSKIRYNPFAKVKPIRSQPYRIFIHTCPCIIANVKGVEAHHEGFDNGVMGSKVSDINCIPLIPEYHTFGPLSIHRLGWREFERVHNVDLRDIILRQIEYFISQGGKF